ncbi:transcriptional regulator (plasmid) [Azospirillum argentinense]|uniref:Transcriptional regulator n=1 Tax=Azospirillum argentinense TaxID=2970906 RepID=A0A2K1G6N9_9PROT|nr:MarR family transcriptional regulator [Azospirillum argentinense]AIB13792.1 transcriptional regulator [Azospirillum argentinense]EZQ05912.1 transcriptional regulator [Azospirillum argentinense]KAA1054875.1 transcriptional activator of exopolysaccharide II synthesis, MarR family protein [Azospirillum argentinense]MBK3797765.1 MarR family transcriptional regulator [Azospirillum argentinense]PNR00438.1 MarR family transcriptional regulator [Azospirillum argentinense]
MTTLVQPQPTEDAERNDAERKASATQMYHEVARIIERMHRRFLDVLRIELSRIGIDDISPVQVMMLLNISNGEISVRDLIERGYYLGSNASYNLKQLVDSGYVDRSASPRDKRAARLKLSARGLELCERLRHMASVHSDGLIRTDGDSQDFEVTYRTLRRLERKWTDVIRSDETEIL